MFVVFSISFARSSRKTFRPFSSRVVSPFSAALAMSIASEGLQPPGTRNILTPSPAFPCFSTTSLNLVTALSVKLTILPPCRNHEPRETLIGTDCNFFYFTNIFVKSQLFFTIDDHFFSPSRHTPLKLIHGALLGAKRSVHTRTFAYLLCRIDQSVTDVTNACDCNHGSVLLLMLYLSNRTKFGSCLRR